MICNNAVPKAEDREDRQAQESFLCYTKRGLQFDRSLSVDEELDQARGGK